MKKILLLIISTICLFLTACSNGEKYTTMYSVSFVTTNTNPTQIIFQVGSIVLIIAIVIGIVVWIRKRK